MNKIVFMVAALASLAFADVIYLRSGEEVQDVVVVEIGIDNVKYKIADMDVAYTIRKADAIMVIYSNGRKDIFDSGSGKDKKRKERSAEYSNFSAGKRFATWGVNWVPGAGSIIFMRDWTGAFAQWGLIGGALIANGISLESRDYVCSDNPGSDGFIYCNYKSNKSSKAAGATAMALYGTYIAWNTFRSVTYDKPKPENSSASGSKYGDFGLAVLPGGNGDFKAYLLYGKGF